jgi:hypothetical protein
MTTKPSCQLTGTDGNVYSLLGKVTGTLKKAGLFEQAKECSGRVFKSHSYHEALSIMQEYVEAE